jgi:hypothetical protein
MISTSNAMALILNLIRLNRTEVYSFVAPSLQTLAQQGCDDTWKAFQSNRLVLAGLTSSGRRLTA